MHNNEPAPSLPALDFETTQERHEREERERRALATDPQRAEDLSVLSAAMVAVDVLDDRFFVAEPRPSMEADEGALKRRSLGWAVRVEPVGSENVVGAGSARRARNESVASTVSAVSPDNAGGEQRERRQYLTAGEQTGGHDPEYWRAVQRRRSWTTGDQRLETGIVMYR